MEYLKEFLDNRVFFTVLFAWIMSCLLKGCLVWAKEKKPDKTRFFGTGGMPSSHSTIVSSLATCIGIKMGFESPVFVICCALAFVVMYDATGIRRAAGQQARTINKMLEDEQEDLPTGKQTRLEELLGHNPSEVIAGAALGIVIAVLAEVVVGL